MQPNRIREKLNAGEPTLATHVHTTWPGMIEVIGLTGIYDYVEFVAEYAPFDLHDLENFCRAAELHNLSTMIKVDQAPRSFLAQRAIGAGFSERALCRQPHRGGRGGVRASGAGGYAGGPRHPRGGHATRLVYVVRRRAGLPPSAG